MKHWNIHRPNLNASLVVIIILGILDIGAKMTNLYYILPWWDILTHFLGGVWLGFLGVALFGRYLSKYSLVITVIIFVLIAAFAWELFEQSIGMGSFSSQKTLDTTHDFINAFVGSIIALIIQQKSTTLRI